MQTYKTMAVDLTVKFGLISINNNQRSKAYLSVVISLTSILAKAYNPAS